MEEVTMWRTTDGAVFDDKSVANNHEALIGLKTRFYESVGSIKDVSYERLLGWMKLNLDLANDMIKSVDTTNNDAVDDDIPF